MNILQEDDHSQRKNSSKSIAVKPVQLQVQMRDNCSNTGKPILENIIAITDVRNNNYLISPVF